MIQHNELLGPHHLEQPVLVLSANGTWEDVSAVIIGILDAGARVAVAFRVNGQTDTLLLDRDCIKLKF